ncbi:MAG: hypothetical protein Q7V88_09165 [Actinomycetota bacterium]|nr:hypothetical protein [Actinomycetota bacterium]
MANGQRVAISAWGHGSWEPGLPPIGIGVVRVTADEAVMKGRFFLDTAAGHDTFVAVKELHKHGLGEWSYSLHDVTSTRQTINGRPVRVISSVTIAEVSPVMRGASMNTRTLSAKDLAVIDQARETLDGLSAADRAELEAIRKRSDAVYADLMRAEFAKFQRNSR